MAVFPAGRRDDNRFEAAGGSGEARRGWAASARRKANGVTANGNTTAATVLAIETSCDESAAGIVRIAPGAAGGAPDGAILANVVLSQAELHGPYGGVVPEIAARAHVEWADRVVAAALAEAGLSFADLDAVAATAGPGLVGGLLVGLVTGRTIAGALGLPFFGINHLEAHALTARLTDGLAFPYVVLLVSGGHSQFILVEDVGRYVRLGGTIDDAAGEAFDKTAKLLGLGYPGGPAVERAAAAGDPARFAFPTPMERRPGLDLSFSGLKTAVRIAATRLGAASEADVADIAAGFQAAVARVLAAKGRRAVAILKERHPDAAPVLVVAGGVAANATIRAALGEAAAAEGARLVAPPLPLCGDNGVMVAWAAAERLVRGEMGTAEAKARARWPLDETAPPILGAGRKGAKA